MLALPEHRPAVVWMFITAIFLPLGPSNSTMSAPLWMALHSNHACLEKEKLSLLPCQPMALQEKNVETLTITRAAVCQVLCNETTLTKSQKGQLPLLLQIA